MTNSINGLKKHPPSVWGSGTKDLKENSGLLILLIVIYAGAGFLRKNLPSGFLPDEDRSFIMINAELPPAASGERTAKIASEIENILLSHPAVSSCFSVSNFSLFNGTRSPNYAAIWVMIKPLDKRSAQKDHVSYVVADLRNAFQKIKEAKIMALLPPSIPGLGTTEGFSFMIKQRSGTVEELEQTKKRFLAGHSKTP